MSQSLHPQHVAIIMDGNRRWARQQGLAIIEGHRKMTDEMIERLALKAIKENIPYLTLWAFSTENWQREQQEVDDLMTLFRQFFDEQITRLQRHGIRINTIGELSRFDQDIQDKLAHCKEETKDNKKLVLTIALNYGGRDEIIRAMRRMLTAHSQLTPEEVDENLFAQYLDTNQGVNLPDPDLIIRPGRVERLSGYLTWQSVYSELYFPDLLMPDFDEAAFDQALADYAQRQRRFGR